MTQPWATAHVDAELHYGDLDQELVRRLSRSSEIAARAVQKNFTQLSQNAQKTFERMETAYDRRMQALEKRTGRAVITVNKRLDKVTKKVDVKVDLDPPSVRKRVSAVNKEIRGVDKRVGVDVDVDKKAAARGARRAAKEAQRTANRHPVEIPVRMNRMTAVNTLSTTMSMLTGFAVRSTKVLTKFTALAGLATVAVGALVPVIGALGSGLAAVGGAAGVWAIGGIAALGAAAVTLKVAFTGVGEAIKNSLDPAKAEEFAAAMEKLTPAARETVRAIQSIGQAWKDAGVQAAVQEAFFAGLAPGIAQLTRWITPLKNSLMTVAEGFNLGADGALRMINSANGISATARLLDHAGRMGGKLGQAVFGAIPGFVALGSAATQVLSPMTDGLGSMAEEWSRNLLAMQQTGALQDKMRGLLDTAAQFGRVLAEVGTIIGGVFRAASAAGNGNPLAGWEASLQKISDWVNGPVGQGALTSFFESATAAMGAILPVLLQVAGVIGAVVAPIIADLATSIGPALVPAIQAIGEGIAGLTPMFSFFGEVLATVIRWITPLLPLLVQMAPSLLVIVGAAMGFLKVIKIIDLLKKAWLAFNVVFAMSPVGLIITAVVALVAALALFFTKTEVGRRIWETCWNAIKTAAVAVWEWFKTNLLPGLQAGLQLIGQVVMWLWQNVMQPAWQGIQVVIGVVWNIIKGYFTVWMTVIRAVAAVVMWLWNTIISPAFQGIRTVIGVVWGIVRGIFNAWMAVIRTLASVVMWLWNSIVQPAISGIGSVISTVYNSVIRPVWDAFKSALESVGEVVGKVVGWIKDRWNDMSVGFRIVKDKFGEYIENVKGFFTGLWNKVKEIVDKIVEKFNSIKDKVKGAVSWIPGIGNAAGGPVIAPPGFSRGGGVPWLASGGAAATASTAIAPDSFIINARQTRRNKKLLRKIAPSGRTISGPGTGTSDSIVGKWGGKATSRVSTGEYYVPPQRAAQIMPLLWAINAGAKVGAMLGALIPGFDAGGLTPHAQSVRKYIFEKWPTIKDIGGYRPPDGYNEHSTGNALDVMIPDWSGAGKRTGDEVLAWAQKNAAELGYTHAIWQQKFFPKSNPDGSMMEDRGSPTQNHMDHVHLFMNDEPKGGIAAVGGPDSAGISNSDAGNLGSTSFSSGSSSTPIGSGISTSSGGSASWGNSGGGSKFNSATEAKRGGVTPVWIENWPASIGGGGSGGSDLSSTVSGDPSSLSTGSGNLPAKKDLKKGASKQDMMDAVYRIGKEKGMSDEEILAAGETLLAESDGKNYANSNVPESLSRPHDAVGSDHKSVGVMQQQVGMGWGELDQLMDPEYAIGRFYDEMKKNPGSGPAHQRAQSVQRSAFSDGSNYLAKEGEAKKLLEQSKKNALPVTPEGTVPVTVTNGDDVGTTPPPSGATPAPSTPQATDASQDIGLPDLSGNRSTMAGNTAAWGVKLGMSRDSAAAKYADPAASVASAFVGGQTAAALDPFGFDYEPHWKQAGLRYMQDNQQRDDGTKTLATAITELANRPIQIIIQGGAGDSEEVANKVMDRVKAEQKKTMRRHLIT